MEIMLNEIGRKRVLIPIPFWAASIKALFLEHLRIPFFVPKPMLTRDQVQLLKADNVVRENNLGIQNLGIVPTPLQAVLPSYLRMLDWIFQMISAALLKSLQSAKI